MSKSMFRVYEKDEQAFGAGKKWKLLACFVWKADAVAYLESKHDGSCGGVRYKVMRDNRNLWVV